MSPPPDTPPDDAAASPTELNLITLNCWGLLHISELRSARLAAVGAALAAAQPPPHIVCLQECWTQEDYAAVRRQTSALLPHGKFFASGAFGGGLAILSRWPICESSMRPYALNGRPTAFWRGDWYVGKGVACATVRFGPRHQDVIDVFNTHTHAPYEESRPDDSYLCHRTAQAWEIAKLLRAACRRGHLVLALGDFNMLPLSLAHRIITSRAPVRDVWRVLHPDSSVGPAHHPAEARRGLPVPSARLNLEENGAASDGCYNTWRWPKSRQRRLRAGDPCPVDPDTPDPLGKRLDYIFASLAPATGWLVESAAVTMTERHPLLHVSLSDHFAVSATLRRYLPTPAAAGPEPADPHAAAQLRELLRNPAEPLSARDYDDILAITSAYAARERSQRFWRGLHFYASLFVWLACLVAVWWSPANFVAFLLMLVSTLVLATGVVDGLLALLFFSSEIRALKEFEWEIRNAKALDLPDRTAMVHPESDEPPAHPGDHDHDEKQK